MIGSQKIPQMREVPERRRATSAQPDEQCSVKSLLLTSHQYIDKWTKPHGNHNQRNRVLHKRDSVHRQKNITFLVSHPQFSVPYQRQELFKQRVSCSWLWNIRKFNALHTIRTSSLPHVYMNILHLLHRTNSARLGILWFRKMACLHIRFPFPSFLHIKPEEKHEIEKIIKARKNKLSKWSHRSRNSGSQSSDQSQQLIAIVP